MRTDRESWLIGAVLCRSAPQADRHTSPDRSMIAIGNGTWSGLWVDRADPAIGVRSWSGDDPYVGAYL